jgi:hypothetical protein
MKKIERPNQKKQDINPKTILKTSHTNITKGKEKKNHLKMHSNGLKLHLYK